MTLEIDLDTATMEDLEHFKSIIELKIGVRELEQARLRDREMINTYRLCLIENIKVLLSCNPKINDEKCGLKSLINDFLKNTDKPLWLNENFIRTITCLNFEIVRQYKPMFNTVLDREETLFLLGEFLRGLERLEIKEWKFDNEPTTSY